MMRVSIFVCRDVNSYYEIRFVRFVSFCSMSQVSIRLGPCPAQMISPKIANFVTSDATRTDSGSQIVSKLPNWQSNIDFLLRVIKICNITGGREHDRRPGRSEPQGACVRQAGGVGGVGLS